MKGFYINIETEGLSYEHYVSDQDDLEILDTVLERAKHRMQIEPESVSDRSENPARNAADCSE